MKKFQRNILVSFLLVMWSVAMVIGLQKLIRYANLPGQAGEIAVTWPKDAVLLHKPDLRPALVMFLHPKCPCSRASVEELDTLMAKVSGRADVYAVFVQPVGWSEASVKASLWKRASSIPGVTLLIDRGAQEAKRFGALTSGHLFAFDQRGSLAFSGGITPSRGHQGGNPGRETTVLFLNTGRLPSSSKKTPIFGCALGQNQ